MAIGIFTGGLLVWGIGLLGQAEPSCCDHPYRHGFSRELVQSGVPGEGILDESATCAGSGGIVRSREPFSLYMSVISNASQPAEAVQGFSASIEVRGDVDIADARLVGLADFGSVGPRSASFASIGIVSALQNGGRRGVIAGVSFPLDLNPSAAPPHVGTESMIQLVVGRSASAPPNPAGSIFTSNGLRFCPQCDGVWNEVRAQGRTVTVCNESSARVEVRFNDQVPFRRGDPNQDGEIDLSDALSVFNYLFLGFAAPGCLRSADANGDDEINISDATFILNYLFSGGNAPPDPGAPPAPCGDGPADNLLTCVDFNACQ